LAGEDDSRGEDRALSRGGHDLRGGGRGLADPMALVLANAANQAAEFVGWPEARIPIAEAAIYISHAHKSNSSILGIDAALERCSLREDAGGAGAFAGRALTPGQERWRHWRGLSICHDHPDHLCSAGLSAERTSVTTNRPIRE